MRDMDHLYRAMGRTPPPVEIVDGWHRTSFPDSLAGLDYIEHLAGVDWIDAPSPRRVHRCAAQTRGFIGLSYVERCACGATSLDGKYWMERNSKKRRSH